MISSALFLQALKNGTGRTPNAGQKQAVEAPGGAALFVVAGPGTGKTATLTMRMLKLIFVDGVAPRGILATTFTRKAAQEIRSRLLTWGYAVQEELVSNGKLSKMDRLWLERVDINQVRTGTIDGVCEELLRDFRDPGTDPPILADKFVSDTLLLRQGLFQSDRYKDDDLDTFLCNVRGTGRFGWNIGAKNSLVRTIWDRRHHDQMDWVKFAGSGTSQEEKQAITLLDSALTDYAKELGDRLMVDFAQLEQTVLARLAAGGLTEFAEELKVVLVDEYQDTNLLQERLYFQLAQRCGGALTVVGDDDQSLYRFRGATVDLFSNFEKRFTSTLGTKPTKIFLNENYRSSSVIIDFVNDYASLDAGYQGVRVAGKPRLVNPKPRDAEMPVLGMFRNSIEDLAGDLARFIHAVTRGDGFEVRGQWIRVDREASGDVGDCALLCSSPQEYGSGTPLKERLPLLLRRELGQLNPPIPVFNPRGQDLAVIPSVERLGGLLLECLDPGGPIQSVMRGLSNEIQATFNTWRARTLAWLDGDSKLEPLRDYAVNWASRDADRPGYAWPKSTPCIELLYALIHWMPELHDDPEGQVYLEVFTRQLGAAEQVSGFKARVVTDPDKPDLTRTSVGHLLLYFLAPIASGAAGVDEELIESFPRDRLNMLSIHQSKGLEFPLVIVDVGSDFKGRYPAQAFKRFPRNPGPPHNLEDLLRPHSPLATLRRSGLDRAFDDLYRQYFVAFSRPQDVLLLVGLNATRPGGNVENVATGRDRTGVNRWSPPPFLEI
ncbi:DNA helicase-2 / ATP-dependent DNA helicase PcrA [Singulisphaera sp. GP187]|uniref:UvrD-helicase domain-containing protein n=1 Tax=Singulisphaera sp. GP187 TaxID=1882752 RepID=UPI0009292638|nr:ATP-dependent helicase [Singulisphaera sp. GP187]SIO63291.1 DNA helicase-2 / ATP-dependent DNA helicase PcrA [Singulisphaera sp. GP187]